MSLSLRALGSGKIDGRTLARITERLRAKLKGARRVKATRNALTKSAQALYFGLAGEVNSYGALKRKCGAFNRQLGDLLSIAEFNEDTLLWTASGRRKLSELSGEDIRDLLYRPSRLEAHHIVKGSFMKQFEAQFKKLGERIEVSDDAFKRVDAGWWGSHGAMPAMAIEAELHTVGPARIREVFGTDLDLDQGFSKAFDTLVERRMAEGSGTLHELFDAHLAAYHALMSPEWLSRRIRFGSSEFTLTDYLVSRAEIAREAGL